MTVIAWDGETLAGDKRTNFGGLHATTTKVQRLPDGGIVGCAGNTAQIWEMVHWLAQGADPEKLPAIQRDAKECVTMLVVSRCGDLWQYENSPYPIRIENKQWAIGSGRDFAIAAMRLGQTAAQAVALACELDMGCGNGVDALSLAPLPTIEPHLLEAGQ